MLARFDGSEKQIEEMFNKPMAEITKDLFKPMKEQLLVRRMQQEIYKNLEVTPAEVQKFFRKIPENQLPLRPESMEIREISLKPEISEVEITRVQDRLKEFRDRIQKGENMSTLAALYSEDPGSALRGGELGPTPRGSLVPEFAAVAFNLKGNEVSRIVKTDFGYHIMQLIDRRGDIINVRHILLIPKPTSDEKIRVKTRLDSIARIIREGQMKFEDAALRYSNEKNTRFNGGLVVNSGNSQNANPQNAGTTWFEPQELAPEVLNAIRNLKIGEISEVFESRDDNNNIIYKIVTIKSRQPAHRADIRQDYQFLQTMALQEKQQKTLNDWVARKQESMYIRIDADFRGCEFQSKGWLK
jgi:peptidyl-prolyl cis-trans isomerase SurA